MLSAKGDLILYRACKIFPLSAFMEILASRITEELKSANHCAVYEPELSRVWPTNGKRSEAAVTLFAEKCGLRLRYYKDGFCAIFDKAPSGRKKHKRRNWCR